ncbi:ribose 5-phosphate isomerase A-domain-containing protein [Triangularia verruculosa]|uniref:Ribose-5-phosphate isomerase n=1 Tax=Triangularia verruculosa TaxID=2587418 RepID=A0AAN6XWL0_9PEZI|nr:ribose 5-phosphate isomerase A-domain-containing protein [Triangularia verruculosa]
MNKHHLLLRGFSSLSSSLCRRSGPPHLPARPLFPPSRATVLNFFSPHHHHHHHQSYHSPPSPYPLPTAKMSTSTTTTSPANLIEQSKRLAAFQSVTSHLVPFPNYTRIGIGSGSTVIYVVEAISSLLLPSTLSAMTFYPTGAQSEQLIEAAGLNLQYINKLPPGALLDVCFDGADEVDPALNLIKGGGACLWQEKIVVTSSKKFVCVADFRKISKGLGTSWTKGIPIEVLPLAANRVLGELKRMGSLEPRVRPGLPGKAGAVVTDNGMWIIDAPFKPLRVHGESDREGGEWQVDELAEELIRIPGVAEIGLFYGRDGVQQPEGGAQKPVEAYFGMEDGSVKVLSA